MESVSYMKRVVLVVIFVFVVFVFNLIVGCFLEKIWWLVMRRIYILFDNEDEIVFGLDLVFGLVNLICMVLLVWEVYNIFIWIL